MVRGAGFSVLESVDSEALVTLHVTGLQYVVQLIRDSVAANVACVFFKGLANIITTATPGDAISIQSALRHRFSAAGIEPDVGSKDWEPFFAYERRLLNLASKDPSLVQRATENTATSALTSNHP